MKFVSNESLVAEHTRGRNVRAGQLWDVTHAGEKSSLLPTMGKRTSSRQKDAGRGVSSFKRTGWAAKEGEPEKPKKMRKPRTAAEPRFPSKVSAGNSQTSKSRGDDIMSRKRKRSLFPERFNGVAVAPSPAREDAPAVHDTANYDGVEVVRRAGADDGSLARQTLRAVVAYAQACTHTIGARVYTAHVPTDHLAGPSLPLLSPATARPSRAVVLCPDVGPSLRRRKSRSKKTEEGDWKELKPRHLRGKRKEELLHRQVAHLEAAAERRKVGSAPDEHTVLGAVRSQLARLLRPKLRRWAMYEWFYSPVDFAWFRENAFLAVLQVNCPLEVHHPALHTILPCGQDAGLGHVTHLTRIEWSYLRSLFGKPRRISSAFFEGERARLRLYREEVRALRRLQGANGSVYTAMLEAELGVQGTAQMAVGQRVTACHPKERQICTGTVLTPDGDDYRVQFDRQKHGVRVSESNVCPL